MTTIAAVRTPTAWLLACDTMAASNDGRRWPVETKLSILRFDHDQNVVIGSTGHRMIQTAVHIVDWIGIDLGDEEETAKQRDVDWAHGFVQLWTEHLYTTLRERHVPTCDDGLIDAAQLLAYRGRLWMLTDGLAEPITAPFTAIGSGGDLAVGYLDGATQHVQPEEALRGAIACAVRHDTGSGGDAHLVALHDDGTVRHLSS